jgi:hypothetical protein
MPNGSPFDWASAVTREGRVKKLVGVCVSLLSLIGAKRQLLSPKEPNEQVAAPTTQKDLR